MLGVTWLAQEHCTQPQASAPPCPPLVSLSCSPFLALLLVAVASFVALGAQAGCDAASPLVPGTQRPDVHLVAVQALLLALFPVSRLAQTLRLDACQVQQWLHWCQAEHPMPLHAHPCARV